MSGAKPKTKTWKTGDPVRNDDTVGTVGRLKKGRPYQHHISVTDKNPIKGPHKKPQKVQPHKPEESRPLLQTTFEEISNETLGKITNFLIENIKELTQFDLSDKDLISLLSLIARACDNDLVHTKTYMLKCVIEQRFMTKLRTFFTSMVTIEEPSKDPILHVLTILENGMYLIPNGCKELVEMMVKNLLLILPVFEGDWSSELERVTRLKKDVENIGSVFKRAELEGFVDDDETSEMQTPPNDIRYDYHVTQFKCHELTHPARGFIRKNIIKGPYSSFEDYIDIHFRLLREDFLSPIREDLCDYLNHKTKHMFNIKIHQNVKFLESRYEKDKILTRLQFYMSEKLSKFLSSGQHKRFMHGTLLIFSKDNFKTLFTGKVMGNDHLLQGRLDVDIHGDHEEDIYNDSYTMVECSIFYEPYFQVLGALQKLKTIPFKRYIIKVEANIDLPKYMENEPSYNLPSFLNNSQTKAMHAALNKELVIIQGPPGTGKTFLGMELVKILLKIKESIELEGPILIVTYTNHALEQFLAGLRESTKKIVRLGHGSKDLRILLDQAEKGGSTFLNYIGREEEKSLYRSLKENEQEIEKKRDLLKQLNLKLLVNLEVFQGWEPIVVLCWLMCNDGTVLRQKNHPKDDNYEDILNLLYKFRFQLHALRFHHVLRINSLRNIGKFINPDYYEELSEDINFLSSKANFLQQCLNTDFGETTDELENYKDIFEIPCRTRWQIYQREFDTKKASLRDELAEMEENQLIRWENLFKSRERVDAELLQQMDIVAMTTTHAAKMRSTLEFIQCPIVLVEEAAEVLESHIISALTMDCQHLILLGDHQQLRPKTADNTIRSKYNLGISLFERMVRNNIECHTLNVQHRMRPEISSLICPVFYKELLNDREVEEYPLVSGIKYPVYFIDHLEREEPYGDSSKMNVYEAKFFMQLAIFLLNNNYKPEDITILAAYRGQMYQMKEQQSLCKNEQLQEVEIAVVDNFQGEENKIILLSLVRNNPEGSVGFLSTDNRVCVALSRAKHGLYIMGNMDQLCQSAEMWQSIRSTLETQHAIGRYLPLSCKIHPDHETLVSKVSDFEKVPNGGCKQMCNTDLECGHRCDMICHPFDRDHKLYKCKEKCNRLPCDNPKHPCCRLCFEECGPCNYSVEHTFDCGHKVKLECHKDITKLLCNVQKTINPVCGHENTIPCHQDEATYKCPVVVQRTLGCLHLNKMPCEQELEKFECQQENNIKLMCGHVFLKKCNELAFIAKCKEIVQKTLSCNHTANVACGEPIENVKCSEEISETLPCGHVNKIKCSESNKYPKNNVAMLSKCQMVCMKRLPCGHICNKKCSVRCEPCEQRKIKTEENGRKITIKCGAEGERKKANINKYPGLRHPFRNNKKK